ncbi:MAG: LLM class flavin-dependent oxidoreductase [Dehalococcoidia bacterium]|nr:LLM class flavin-dependent oxidoreductase [Dehalococcoidia bacterium]
MRYGFVMSSGDARQAAGLAREAEQAGWDGFFVWEPVWGIDAWVSLTAAAMVTERIRLGTMLSPLSRMRPWEMASKAATLDNLSKGRVILSVGLGAVDSGLESFGEVTDIRERAELLDESLDVITGLWRGQPFNFDGKHYHVRETTFSVPPPPVQQPRIPIWVVGVMRPKSLARALRYDGLIHQGEPEALPALRAWLAERRSLDSFDVVVEGTTPSDDESAARATADRWEQVGATWYNEANWSIPEEADRLAVLTERIRQGPPH